MSQTDEITLTDKITVAGAIAGHQGAMSDHSTGSSGSSTNSWTMLSPEETAVEAGGPDDGTESLSGVPGLPEEKTGGGVKTLGIKGPPAETVFSEEGQQVCQETSPDACEAAAFIDSAFSGFEEGEVDPEIHAPVIHDTITTSPPDSDLLGSTPFTITSESTLLFSEDPAFATHTPPEKKGEDSSSQEPHIKELPDQESPGSDIHEEHCPTLKTIIEESGDSSKPMLQQSSSPGGHLEESHAHEGHPVGPIITKDLTPVTVTPEILAPFSSTPDPPSDVSQPDVTSHKPPAPGPHFAKNPNPEPVSTETTSDINTVVEAAAPEAKSPPDVGLNAAAPTPEPQTISSFSAQQEEEEERVEEEDEEHRSLGSEEFEVPGKHVEEPMETEEVTSPAEPEAGGDGLRHRHAPPVPPSAPEPFGRSSEDEEEEEEEFQMAERRQEEKGGFALNKLIVGALVLLCLGSLFFSDDGFDGSEMTEQELLERLTQEGQQISTLEAQLKSQKEALDQALQAASEKEGAEKGDVLQKENVKLREEVAAMPGLLQELESLRARVAELSQLTVRESETLPTIPDTSTTDQSETANQIPAGPEGGVKEEAGADELKAELARQKSLLEDSRKRLEGMKKSSGGRKKGVREGLVEMQKRLSEQVERLDKRHDWKKKQHQEEARKHQGKSWAGKEEEGSQQSGKKEKTDQWEGKKKHSGQWEGKEMHRDQKNGRKEHSNKWDGKKDHNKEKYNEHSEKRREEKDWKNGKNGKDDREAENSKHAWKKYHKEWDGRKQERKVEREKRKSERPWDAKSFKKTSKYEDHHSHHHHDSHSDDHHHHEKDGGHKREHVDFWKHQEQKLRRNPGPAKACTGAAQCAEVEGLLAVELSEFQALLDGYLSKLPASSEDDKQNLQKLVAEFFPVGVFDHQHLLFSDFAEDVADILEDLADVLNNESLEDDMEEFEREALWKFAAAA